MIVLRTGSYFPITGNELRPEEKVYNPQTKTWVDNSSCSITTKEGVTIANADRKSAIPSYNAKTNNNNKQNENNVQKNSDKEFIENEINTLKGSISVYPSDITMILEPNDTINIQGIGNNLSGNYFIDEVEITVDSSNGLDIKLNVLRTGFADSMKKQKVTNSRLEKVK